MTSSVSQRVTTWGWIGIESSPQPVFDTPYDPFFVVVIRIWDWSRWRAGEKVFPTEITLTTTQPDITQVHMFHSRHLNLGKPNAKTGALQMLTLGSFCPLTDQQRVCSKTTWMFVESSQCKNGLIQTKPDCKLWCKEINWSLSFAMFILGLVKFCPLLLRYCSEFSGAIICQKYDVSIFQINYPDGLCEDTKIWIYISKCTIIQRFFSDFRDGPKYAFNGLFSNAGDLVMVQLLLLTLFGPAYFGRSGIQGRPPKYLGVGWG